VKIISLNNKNLFYYNLVSRWCDVCHDKNISKILPKISFREK